MRGANYVPSYARNDVQTWMDYDPAVIDRELGYAAKLKLNVVRVFLQVAVYEAAPQRFLDNLENLLSLCAKHQIRLMPVLFDSCFDPQTVNLKDYHDKKWMPSPGFSRLGAQDRPAMERYIHAVVGAHKDDQRIVLWDVMNKPESTAHYGDWERGGRATIDAFVRWSLRRVKEEKPTQPLTIGWAYQNNNIVSIDLVDVICIHQYCPSADLARWIRERTLGPVVRQAGDPERVHRTAAAAVRAHPAHRGRTEDWLVLLGTDDRPHTIRGGRVFVSGPAVPRRTPGRLESPHRIGRGTGPRQTCRHGAHRRPKEPRVVRLLR